MSGEAHPIIRYAIYTRQSVEKAYDELADKLHLLDQKIKPSDHFNVRRFHEDVGSLRAKLPQSDDDLRDLDVQLRARRRARVASMDPWERLEIDWDRFHPRARELLNDPFFWEGANDFAPHGSDTGCDVFADYRKWARRHPGRPMSWPRRWFMPGRSVSSIGTRPPKRR